MGEKAISSPIFMLFNNSISTEQAKAFYFKPLALRGAKKQTGEVPGRSETVFMYERLSRCV